MDRRLLILALGMFALGTDNFVVAGILPMVARSMNSSVSLVGQMVTLYAISYAVLSPVMAAMTARLPRKHPIWPLSRRCSGMGEIRTRA